jgi:hypothetical protein
MTEELKVPQQTENKDKQQVKKETVEEFSIKWHLKTLSVIYVILFIFYF